MGHKNGQLGQGERLPARGELATCLIRTLTTATIPPLTADVSILTGEGNEKFLKETELGEEEERKEGGSRRWAGGVLSPLLSDNGVDSTCVFPALHPGASCWRLGISPSGEQTGKHYK